MKTSLTAECLATLFAVAVWIGGLAFLAVEHWP